MKKVTAIVPAAGLGKRFGQGGNKPFQMLGNKPLVAWVFEVLESINEIAEIIPVFKKDDMALGCDLLEKFKFSKVKRIAAGGRERQDSVYGALALIDKETDAVLIHDGVRPLIEKSIVEESIRQLRRVDGVVVGVPLKDTIKEVRCQSTTHGVSGVRRKGEEIIVKKTLNRSVLWAIQTPQVFKYSVLMKAYRKAMDERFYSTDDSAIVEKYGGKVKAIMGSYSNLKITTPEDLDIAELLLKKRTESASCRWLVERTGFGYDSHRLINGRKLIIGGVEIPFEKGLTGHSDADVLCHAIIDSLIGALGRGDIGKHFPDTEPEWKDASSIALLKNVIEMVAMNGFEVLWIDSTIIAERPSLSPYIDSMKKALSGAGIPPELINIKAKTNEGMGFTGRGEGIAAYAVCLLGKP